MLLLLSLHVTHHKCCLLLLFVVLFVVCFFFEGFPSGHASMAFAGVFGTGLIYFMIPWILDGLINGALF